jgi:hypothetical protein
MFGHDTRQVEGRYTITPCTNGDFLPKPSPTSQLVWLTPIPRDEYTPPPTIAVDGSFGQRLSHDQPRGPFGQLLPHDQPRGPFGQLLPRD